MTAWPSTSAPGPPKRASARTIAAASTAPGTRATPTRATVQGYNRYYGRAQVVGITGVERRQNGLKVSGLLDTRMGRGSYGQYNQNGQYNQYGQAYPGYPNQGYPEPGLRPAGLWQPGL